jgi:hypothetical protein
LAKVIYSNCFDSGFQVCELHLKVWGKVKFEQMKVFKISLNFKEDLNVGK